MTSVEGDQCVVCVVVCGALEGALSVVFSFYKKNPVITHTHTNNKKKQLKTENYPLYPSFPERANLQHDKYSQFICILAK